MLGVNKEQQIVNATAHTQPLRVIAAAYTHMQVLAHLQNGSAGSQATGSDAVSAGGTASTSDSHAAQQGRGHGSSGGSGDTLGQTAADELYSQLVQLGLLRR